MRVLHISSGNLFGGVETMLLTCANSQVFEPRLQHELALCFDGRLSQELEVAGATLHRLPTPRASRPYTVVRSRKALTRLLRSRQFDRVICHAPWSQAIFGPTVRRAGLPLAFWVHGPLFGWHWTERWARRSPPDLIICTSHFTASTVQRLYRRIPLAVIHPPVDTSHPALSAGDRRQVRRELRTAEADVVLVQVSRAEAWKGHAELVDALARLRDVPAWVWWLVGGAQRRFEIGYLESLRQRAARLGIADRVRFVGERPDARRVLAAADIHCQANVRPEPFGIAFVEALAAGLPVVTVAMGGALEIVDESCGILVPPGDHAALAEALRQLIRDPALRARLSAVGPSRARVVSDPTTQLSLLHRTLSDMGNVGRACSSGPESDATRLTNVVV